MQNKGKMKMENKPIISTTDVLKQFYLNHWQWIWTTAIGLTVAIATLWVRFEFLLWVKQGG